MDYVSPRVVVTGAFGALGRVVVEHLQQAGARVVGLDHAAAPGTFPAIRVLGGLDLSDPAVASRAITEAADAMGGIDALINIAGGFQQVAAAAERGANAVVAVDIDYETVGGQSSMLMVSVSGTAVLVE